MTSSSNKISQTFVLLFKKLLLALLFSIATVLSISLVEMDCDDAVFSFIVPWIRIGSPDFLSVHQFVIISHLLVNIGVVFLIYFLLLFKLKIIKKHYIIIALLGSLLGIFNLTGITLLRGDYRFIDNHNILAMNTEFARNEYFERHFSFFLTHNFRGYEQCKPFY